MKKNDIILIIGIAILALGAIALLVLHQNEGAKVLVTVDGKVIKELDLHKDQVFPIEIEDDKNIIQIKDGYATMIEANCPDLICVHQKAISKEGESIVCLPHKVIVTVEGGEESSLDSVSQ